MFGQDVSSVSFGTLTGVGVIVPLVAPQAKFWTVLLDCSAIGTANLTVAIQVWNPVTATFVSPSQIGNPLQTNPFVIAFGTVAPLILIPGPLAQVRINIASFGTSTGSFTGVIWAI